jgi:hypothetical protein
MISIEQILSNIETLYASCTSYRDSGVAKFVIETEGDVKIVSNNRFQTLAVPPGFFRFQFRDELFPSDQENVVCIKPNSAESNVFNCDRETSLTSAVAKMQGISKGAAALITTMIFDELNDLLQNRVIDLDYTDLKVIHYNNRDCFELSTTDDNKLICGQQDFLIRHVRACLSAKPKKFVNYEFDSVAINEPLSPELFVLGN